MLFKGSNEQEAGKEFFFEIALQPLWFRTNFSHNICQGKKLGWEPDYSTPAYIHPRKMTV